MDAIHFINEMNRMCKSHDEVCTGCPLMNSNCLVNDFDVEAEKVVPIVEKWSEEHPKIDNGARVMKIIEEMGAPRATLKPGWIPVTERLPEEKDAGILKKLGVEKRSEYVLATVEVKGERMTVTACTHDGKWDWKLKYAFPDFKVVAWMQLPEPYKGGE